MTRMVRFTFESMAADKELLKEVALELWNTTKKLRPGLPKAPRAQLVLKALLTIGDMSDQLEAAMVLGVIEAQEPCLLYTSPSPRDLSTSRMPSSA